MTPEIAEKRNFTNLVLDIAWFGLALAATSRFLSLYAIRLGADNFELSLIGALPGLLLLLSTGFSGWWRRKFSGTVKALLLPGFAFRFVFLLPALAPFMPPEYQPLWLILAVTIPALPQGVAGAIFVTMMRETVSQSRFSSLTSQRALAMNITVAMGAVAFGVLLELVPFPYNYQLMFLLAFGFSLISQWYALRVQVIYPEPVREVKQSPLDIWRLPGFKSVAFVTTITHMAFFSLIMVTPLHLVETLGAGEGFMAAFGLLELVAGATVAMFTTQWIQRLGTQTMIALSMIGTAIAALIIALAPTLEITLIAAFISGASWTAATIGVLGYLVEKTPTESSTQSSVAYHQVIAIGIFVGPLLGGLLLDLGIGLVEVLVIGAILRLMAGLLTQNNPIDMMRRRPRNLYALQRRGRGW